MSIFLSALLASTTALAAPAALGTTAFYPNSDFTGNPVVVSSVPCNTPVRWLSGHFSSVDNRPRPGCSVQLYSNASPRWVTLCVGRSVLPRTLQYNPNVRAVPGSSVPCAPSGS